MVGNEDVTSPSRIARIRCIFSRIWTVFRGYAPERSTSNRGQEKPVMLLAYDDDGPGPVVVLLHGFPLDRTMWSHQRSSIGSMYRVISPDLRGHGTSAAPDGIYSVDEMADDVIELLDALQLDQPIVIGGLSLGGYVALSIAIRHPERVKRLMLLNSRAAADSPEAARNRELTANQIEATGDSSSFLDGILPKLFAKSTIENHPELLKRWRSRMAKIPSRTIVGTLRGLATRPDRSGDLAKITVPTLVIAGAEDQIVPLDESTRMAGAFPDARLIVVPAAGHLAPLENHQAADSAILAFLERDV
jgi:pimeloyl-ACP methyl ester carboxylesterase